MFFCGCTILYSAVIVDSSTLKCSAVILVEDIYFNGAKTNYGVACI